MVLGPTIGEWADRQESRLSVVRIGCSVQALTSLLAVFVLSLLLGGGGSVGDSTETNTHSHHTTLLLFLLMTCIGVCESLSSNMAGIAVQKDWVPCVFDSPDIDSNKLKTTNYWMNNIDLSAEVVGPCIAGFVIGTCSSTVMGFFVVGFLNTLSFLPEYLLLKKVHGDCARLRAPKVVPEPVVNIREGDGGSSSLRSAWPQWLHHPSGVPVFTLAYAFLYFTALSPHGIPLSAYLAASGVSPLYLGMFRGAGALAGTVGTSLFHCATKAFGVRRASLYHVVGQAVVVVFAAMVFPSHQHTSTDDDLGLSTAIVLFMVAVVLSRVGLYGFDLGVLGMQQDLVDERDRNAVGAVVSALCSFFTLSMYALTIGVSDVEDFHTVTWLSALAVVISAVTYMSWINLWHSHEHHHPPGEPGHKHTSQQLRTLEGSEDNSHSHLHYVGWFGGGGDGAGAGGHSHDHNHDHGHRHGNDEDERTIELA